MLFRISTENALPHGRNLSRSLCTSSYCIHHLADLLSPCVLASSPCSRCSPSSPSPASHCPSPTLGGLSYYLCFTRISSHDIRVNHTSCIFVIGRASAACLHRDRLLRCPNPTARTPRQARPTCSTRSAAYNLCSFSIAEMAHVCRMSRCCLVPSHLNNTHGLSTPGLRTRLGPCASAASSTIGDTPRPTRLQHPADEQHVVRRELAGGPAVSGHAPVPVQLALATYLRWRWRWRRCWEWLPMFVGFGSR